MLLHMARVICENFYCMMNSVRALGSDGNDLEEVKKEIIDLMSKNGFSLDKIQINQEEVVENNVTSLVNNLNTW